MRVITVLSVGLQLLLAGAAGAQTRVDLVPSATLGSIYDNNLFAKNEGSAGQMLVLRPGFAGAITSPRLGLVSDWWFDAQRSNFASLNSLAARRHAMAELNYQATEGMTVGLATRYDRTDTPGDVDLVTGILGNRHQAHRLQITPNVSQRVWNRTFVRASYDFVDETLIENVSGRLHTVRSGLTYEYNARTTLSAGYMGRQFVDRFETNVSNTPVVGVERTISPGTRITLQAGPRFSSYRSVRPEIQLGYMRSTTHVGLVFDYWHGETIVIGIHGPVAVDSLSGRAVFPLSRHIEVGTQTAYSGITTLDDTKVTLYRGTLVMSWNPDAWYAVSGSYGLDYQIGDIRRGRIFLDGTEFISDDRVLRHVLRLSVTVAPRLSRLFQSPADPAARAKGVIR